MAFAEFGGIFRPLDTGQGTRRFRPMELPQTQPLIDVGAEQALEVTAPPFASVAENLSSSPQIILGSSHAEAMSKAREFPLPLTSEPSYVAWSTEKDKANYPPPRIPKDPLYKHPDMTDYDSSKEDRHRERWRDAPIWFAASLRFNLKFPFVHRESISANAQRIAEKPNSLINQVRIEEAFAQELREQTHSRREKFLLSIKTAGSNLLLHHGVSAVASTVGNIILNNTIFGRIIYAGLGIKNGAPEEIIPNLALIPLDGVITAGIFAALAIPIPVVSLLAAGAMTIVSILYNRYINNSLARRYESVNDYIIPYAHRIVSPELNPYQDARRDIYVGILRGMKANSEYSSLFIRIKAKRRNLDPFNTPDPRLRDAHNELHGEMVRINTRVKIRTAYYNYDWQRQFPNMNFFSRQWARLKNYDQIVREGNELKRLTKKYNSLYRQIYKKYYFPFKIVDRMYEMLTLT